MPNTAFHTFATRLLSAAALLAAAHSAHAATITGTITGTAIDPYGDYEAARIDQAGLFGPVNRTYIGDTFTLSYSYNTDHMTKIVGTSGGVAYVQYVPDVATFTAADFTLTATDVTSGVSLAVDASGSLSNIYITAYDRTDLGKVNYVISNADAAGYGLAPQNFLSTTPFSNAILDSSIANITGTTINIGPRHGQSGDLLTISVTSSAAADLPEPASLALLGASLAGLGITRRRRTR